MDQYKHRPFTVLSKDRTIKIDLIVSSLEDLKNKLHGASPARVVLEEDGTEIDSEEYFSFLPDNSILMMLSSDSEWTPQHTCKTGQDCSKSVNDDMTILEECSPEGILRSIIETIKEDISCVVFLTELEMQQLVDIDTKTLTQMLARSTKVVKALQDTCQRHLDRQSDVKDVLDLIRFYDESCSSLYD